MSSHITVLLKEAVDALHVAPQGVYVDATLGAGGHTREILKRLGADGTLVSFDADPTAIESFVESDTKARHILKQANFKNLDQMLSSVGVNKVDGILADLGWRTEQFTEGNRGFSFANDEPLLMTYGDPKDYAFTAADIVNDWKEEDIANVIYAYGEERAARKIAKAIVSARTTASLVTAKQLATVIETVVRRRPGTKIHPATKTFQALRIAVNDELDVLETFIDHAFHRLSSGGYLAIISFHSLEDRIVKHRFRSLGTEQHAVLVYKKPLVPSPEETKANPRARSAKLRVLQKHDTTKDQSNSISPGASGRGPLN